MDKRRILPVWVSFAVSVPAVLVTIWNVFNTVSLNNIALIPECLLLLIACFFAVAYGVFGHKKMTAMLYRCFCYSLMIVYLICITTGAANGEAIAVLLRTVTFGSICVISFAKDLGKKKSFVFGFIAIGFSVAVVFYFLFKSIVSVGDITRTVILVILLIDIYAKYADKAARGSK